MDISLMWQVAQFTWIYKQTKNSIYMASVYVHYLQVWYICHLEASCVHPNLKDV